VKTELLLLQGDGWLAARRLGGRPLEHLTSDLFSLSCTSSTRQIKKFTNKKELIYNLT
jgi:hypothetical protein